MLKKLATIIVITSILTGCSITDSLVETQPEQATEDFELQAQTNTTTTAENPQNDQQNNQQSTIPQSSENISDKDTPQEEQPIANDDLQDAIPPLGVPTPAKVDSVTIIELEIYPVIYHLQLHGKLVNTCENIFSVEHEIKDSSVEISVLAQIHGENCQAQERKFSETVQLDPYLLKSGQTYSILVNGEKLNQINVQ